MSITFSQWFPPFDEFIQILGLNSLQDLPPFWSLLFSLANTLYTGVRSWVSFITTTPINIPGQGTASVLGILLGTGLIIYTAYTIVKWLIPT